MKDKFVADEEKLHSKIDKINRALEDHLNSIEQPVPNKNEIWASQRWWQLGYLRHLLSDLSFYLRQKEIMQIEY